MNERATNTRHDGEELKAPARLVAALKEPPPRRVFVPPTVDDAVLAAARRQIAPRPRFRFHGFRSWYAWPAMATACVVLVGVGYVLTRTIPPKFAREDINQDGNVDILDAFALARDVQVGIHTPASLDLNGDKVVDRRDAEQIAVLAVKLEKGDRS